MENNEYHKGSFCIYSTRFCQEGYCCDCEIHTKMSVVEKFVNRQQGGAQLHEVSKMILSH
jgi:hypothetical protein